MLLDALAARYGTDPEAVTHWSAYRLGLALEAWDAGRTASLRRLGDGKMSDIVTTLLAALL